MRELTRSNEALLAYLNGAASPPSRDRTTIDKLLDDVAALMRKNGPGRVDAQADA
jgi:hypothetical protein